jgi:hypothetical protein
MSKTTKARKYNSGALLELLNEITPVEMEQTKVKMQLAARIEDFRNNQMVQRNSKLHNRCSY